jgi:enterochelin esterase-like enzyme
MKALALLALALVWVAVGVHGAFSYGNGYLTYRGFPPPKDPKGVTSGRLVRETFWSTALHSQRSYEVYLPPGYAAAAARGARFPVLYLLHGSPGSPKQYINVARAGVTLDEGVQTHALRPFLIVSPNGRDGTFRSDTEWANTPHGAYESLVMETVRATDANFATRRGRQWRAIGGASEGGYGAINIALHHLGKFAITESWGGYLWQGREGPFAKATPAQIAANDPQRYIPSLRAQLRRHPLRAFIYKGTKEPAVVRHRARAVARELALAGGHVKFAIFPGGHDWKLWRANTPTMLSYTSHWFGRVR